MAPTKISARIRPLQILRWLSSCPLSNLHQQLWPRPKSSDGSDLYNFFRDYFLARHSISIRCKGFSFHASSDHITTISGSWPALVTVTLATVGHDIANSSHIAIFDQIQPSLADRTCYSLLLAPFAASKRLKLSHLYLTCKLIVVPSFQAYPKRSLRTPFAIGLYSLPPIPTLYVFTEERSIFFQQPISPAKRTSTTSRKTLSFSFCRFRSVPFILISDTFTASIFLTNGFYFRLAHFLVHLRGVTQFCCLIFRAVHTRLIYKNPNFLSLWLHLTAAGRFQC